MNATKYNGWTSEESLPSNIYLENYLFDASLLVLEDIVYIFGGESGGWSRLMNDYICRKMYKLYHYQPFTNNYVKNRKDRPIYRSIIVFLIIRVHRKPFYDRYCCEIC